VTRDDQQRLVEALRFALAAHGAQTRKGRDIPYASHLLAVAALVLEQGGDAAQAAAALLHDVIEDCEGVTPAEIEAKFGADVAHIVWACSDLLEGDTPAAKSGWRERKQRYLEKLQSADARTRLVAACDKLHNLRALIHDLHEVGLQTMERFSASPEQTLWYYREVRSVLGAELPPGLLAELDALLGQLCDFATQASPEC
jgi:(p)ppGpp synthase/HD superfamily hydrolase